MKTTCKIIKHHHTCLQFSYSDLFSSSKICKQVTPILTHYFLMLSSAEVRFSRHLRPPPCGNKSSRRECCLCCLSLLLWSLSLVHLLQVLVYSSNQLLMTSWEISPQD